jgi:hypothetical protein
MCVWQRDERTFHVRLSSLTILIMVSLYRFNDKLRHRRCPNMPMRWVWWGGWVGGDVVVWVSTRALASLCVRAIVTTIRPGRTMRRAKRYGGKRCVFVVVMSMCTTTRGESEGVYGEERKQADVVTRHISDRQRALFHVK